MALFTLPRPDETLGISLCAGVGGLDLGLHIAEPTYRTVCYVERNSFAAATLVARMADASLAEAPIWDDLKTFDGQPWRRRVHIISAGYPCQPFTLSGSRQGEHDPRHLWPDVRRIVDEVQPKWSFFENVPEHLTLGFRDVVRDLQDMGYRVAARVVSAAEVGGSHTRERLFILAHADLQRQREPGVYRSVPCGPSLLQRSQSGGQSNRHKKRRSGLDASLGHLDGKRLDAGIVPLFAPRPSEFCKWGEILESWPELKPCLYRLDDGLAYGLDRSAAAGNGVVPLAAARAYLHLKAALNAP